MALISALVLCEEFAPLHGVVLLLLETVGEEFEVEVLKVVFEEVAQVVRKGILEGFDLEGLPIIDSFDV